MTPHDATESSPPLEPPDEQFLDELFDRLVELLGDGRMPVVTNLIEGREHLRARVLELLSLAREVTGACDPAAPEIEGYSILRKIGEGGMGAVYLAKQERLGGRVVAVKVLPGQVASPRTRERFEREAAALARLRHANIVTVHDVVPTAASCAYAMEWIEGCSLAEVLKHLCEEGTQARRHAGTKEGEGASPSSVPSLSSVPSWLRASVPTSMEAVRHRLQSPPGALSERSYVAFIANTGLSIARALSAVHAAGLLHHDVKPSNILLRRDGTPLLSDFGLVRETDATITQPGSFAGTPAYAPPEQLRGDSENLDARSDVYALGATLYHALALQLPLRGRNPAELLRQIERAGPPPLRKLNPKLPVDLETIVSKAMEADPVRRYQSAAEMADDLERLLTLQPIRARPAGLVTRSIKLVRRNRGAFVGVVAGGLSALAVAALLVVYFVLMPRWVAEHTREARLALLDPTQANNIVSVLYWGRINRRPGDEMGKRVAALEAALKNYDAAIRLSPFDEALKQERATVAAARGIVGWALPTIAHAPGDARVPDDARHVKSRVPEVASKMVGNAHPTPRTTGLYAFLTDDYETAIREWTAYETSRDPLAPPDPLVSAALGVLYLFDDQPGRAYPRLRDAVRAFPNVGFLTCYLADAALKNGDVADAERLLQQAISQPRGDPYGAQKRVQAGILAARGKFAAAEQGYRALGNPGPGLLDLARLLDRQGRTDEALEIFLSTARLGGTVPRRAYCSALEKWWSGLTPERRMSEIRTSLDLGAFNSRSLATRLNVYAENRPRPSRGSDGLLGSLPPSLRRFVAPSLFFDLFAALYTTLSSPSLQSLSLSELAKRMEVHDMSLWNLIPSAPNWLKSLTVAAWRWPLLRHGAATRQKLQLALPRYPRSQPARLLTLVAATIPLGGNALAQSRSYQAVLGTLPEAQGWTFATDGSPAPTVQNGALLQGPTTYATNQDWYRNDVTLDFNLGFTLDLELRIIASTYVNNGSFQRCGYMVRIIDRVGRLLEVAIADTGVFLRTDNSGMNDPFVGFNTLGYHVYSLSVTGGAATLSIDGVPVMTRPVAGPTPECCNYVIFGDATSLGNSQSELRYLRYSNHLACDAAPCFQGLGDLPGGTIASYARRVSDDGSTVAGQSVGTGGTFATRWRSDIGLQSLGSLPGGPGTNDLASSLSHDGSVIVGSAFASRGTCSVIEFNEAYRWTEQTGMVGLGDLPGGCFGSNGTCVSADGTKVLVAGLDDFQYRPGIWQGAGISPIVASPGAGSFSAVAMTPDATVLAGSYYTGTTAIWRWSAATGFENLGDLPGGALDGYAKDITPDGQVIVGRGSSNNGYEACKWQAGVGYTTLGDFAGGTFDSFAYAIAADESLICGYGTSATGVEAAIWRGNGPERAADILTAAGVSIPPGWVLNIATDVTINGNVVTLCGNGTNPQGNPEAWIARYTLPAPPCPGDINGDGVVDLLDLTLLLASFGSSTGGPGFNAAADFDGNGSIDLSDLTTLLAAFGSNCP